MIRGMTVKLHILRPAIVRGVHINIDTDHDFSKHVFERKCLGSRLDVPDNCNICRQKNSLDTLNLGMELKQSHPFFAEGIMWIRYRCMAKNVPDYFLDLK